MDQDAKMLVMLGVFPKQVAAHRTKILGSQKEVKNYSTAFQFERFSSFDDFLFKILILSITSITLNRFFCVCSTIISSISVLI
jgi:hypothetical protein